VNGTTSTRCRNTRRRYCSWQLVRALSGGKGGIPNVASFGSTGVFLSLSRVSTRFPFISKGEFVFLSVAKRIIRQPGSDHSVVDASPPHSWWAARLPPVGTRTGRRTGRVSARSRFCPGRSRATSSRIGVDTPRSFSRREGSCRNQSTGCAWFAMPPFRATGPTPGGWPSGTPSTDAGCFPASTFVPAALSRGFLRIRRRTVDIPRFSARPSSSRPFERVLPRRFRRVRPVMS